MNSNTDTDPASFSKIGIAVAEVSSCSLSQSRAELSSLQSEYLPLCGAIALHNGE